MPQKRFIVKSSVHRALNAVGDRWIQLILQEAFRGVTSFEDFRVRTAASRNTLSNRLRAMIASGILERRAERTGGVRQVYHLTPMGRALFDSVLIAWCWGIRWDAASPSHSAGILHTTCGKSMLPRPVCRHCREDILMHACRHQPGPGAGMEETEVPRLHRRRQLSHAADSGQKGGDVLDLIGDRWTGLVISTQFFGIHRFDQIQATLDIASNILTNRLHALVRTGIFERRLYALGPPRYEYWLTRKGKDLYPQALALMLWGDRWLADSNGPPVVVTHIPCEHPIDLEVVCDQCRQPLTPETVREKRARRQSRAEAGGAGIA